MEEIKSDILVVDDVPANLKLLSETLQSEGYKVRAVLDGPMALLAARSSQPDLILLDVSMPGMSGFEVCRELKSDPKTRSIPIIFISAQDSTEDKVHAFSEGGVDYITKPFQSLEVIARVKNHLVIQQLTDKLAAHNVKLEEEVTARTVELEKMNEVLKEKVDQLSISENKYRTLVEGSAEGIFIIDSEERFISYNQTLLDLLRTSKEELGKSRFTDFIYDDSLNKNVMQIYVKDKLQECIAGHQPIIFKCSVINKLLQEPMEYNIRMEPLRTEGSTEILCKLSAIGDDMLCNFLVSETLEFNIGNQIMTAEELCQRMVRNLVRYIPNHEITMIKIALREMIVNAIEHGNLNITFDEKTESMEKREYLKLLISRQKHPELRSKKVTISYALTPELLRYVIVDEGNGFDVSKIAAMKKEADMGMLAHGRGLLITQNVFNTVEYNDKGNMVTLTKRIKANG